MTTIVTRLAKGSPLSWTEADANFINLNTDKLEASTIGSTVQAHSANLDEYATVNPTAAGLALLDDIDAAAQRTTLSLNNVDNTSDATKNAATVTLTNKTLTTPIITASQNDKLQIGVSGTATNNFTLTAEAVNGTMKLARGNAGATTQDVITVDATGKVAFPQGLTISSTAVSGGLSSGGGSLGAGSWVGARTSIGNLEFITGVVTISSVGTGTGQINVLNANPNSKSGYGSGRSNISGSMLQAHGAGTSVVLNTYDNGSPIGVGSLEFTCILGA